MAGSVEESLLSGPLRLLQAAGPGDLGAAYRLLRPHYTTHLAARPRPLQAKDRERSARHRAAGARLLASLAVGQGACKDSFSARPAGQGRVRIFLRSRLARGV